MYDELYITSVVLTYEQIRITAVKLCGAVLTCDLPDTLAETVEQWHQRLISIANIDESRECRQVAEQILRSAFAFEQINR